MISPAKPSSASGRHLTSLRIRTAARGRVRYAVIAVDGAIDADSQESVEVAMNQAVADGARALVIDLSQATFVSSSGWGLMLFSLKRSHVQAGGIVLVGLRPNVRLVYDMLGIAAFLSAFESEDLALSALEGQA